MRGIVNILMVLLMLSKCTYSVKQYDEYERGGVVILSDRVGEAIDVDERTRYGLFEGVAGFQSAVFYEIVEGGYVLEVIAEDDNYVVINRDPLGLEILRDYIDRNEEARQSKGDFEKKWNIIDYDKTGLPITQNEVKNTRGHGSTIGCGVAGSIGTALLGYGLYTIYGLISALGGDRDDINPWILFGVGLPLGVYTSVLVGISIDESRTVDKIKEARKPKAIE